MIRLGSRPSVVFLNVCIVAVGLSGDFPTRVEVAAVCYDHAGVRPPGFLRDTAYSGFYFEAIVLCTSIYDVDRRYTHTALNQASGHADLDFVMPNRDTNVDL